MEPSYFRSRKVFKMTLRGYRIAWFRPNHSCMGPKTGENERQKTLQFKSR